MKKLLLPLLVTVLSSAAMAQETEGVTITPLGSSSTTESSGQPSYTTDQTNTYPDSGENPCGVPAGGGDSSMSMSRSSSVKGGETQSRSGVNCPDAPTFQLVWRPDSIVQKKWYTIRNAKSQVGVKITIAGEYNVSVTLEGTVKVVKVNGGGNVKVSANTEYSRTWTICASFKDENLQFYTRYYQWKVYSNGTATKTNVYRDEPRDGGYLNKEVGKMSGWNACS